MNEEISILSALQVGSVTTIVHQSPKSLKINFHCSCPLCRFIPWQIPPSKGGLEVVVEAKKKKTRFNFGRQLQPTVHQSMPSRALAFT